MKPVRTWCAVVVASVAVLAGGGGAARGQEAPKYDVLKTMYDQTLASLKAAQDAKNQLATKNEELAKQVAELQKQLEVATKERDDLQRQATAFAERTFQMRSAQAAWQEFLKRYPALHAKWKVFLEAELLDGAAGAPALAEPVWPFRVEG